jgi:beta-phosphoglucomutase-like phosphatase (HAD superfamily)
VTHIARAVLLDVDGTLVDSNDAHALSWADRLGQFGFRVSFDDVRRRIGEGGDKLLGQLADLDDESPRGKEILHARTLAFARLRRDIRPFDGARALVEELRLRDLVVGIAT